MSTRFDASGDSLIIASVPSAPRTIMAWVYISVDRNNYSCFWALDDGAGGGQEYVGTNSTGTNLDLYLALIGDHNGSNLVVGAWNHIALVVTSTANRVLYLNGVADVTTTDSSTPSTSNLYVGNDGGAEFLNGRMEAFKVWTAALTQADVQRDMRFNMPQRWQNLWAWLPMDTVSGVDLGGVRRDFTINGTLSVEPGPPIAWAPRSEPLWVPYVTAAAGRTTKNTRSNPLGMNVGMNRRISF